MASHNSADVVRQRIKVRSDSRRTLYESLALRFPRLTAALLRGTWRVVGDVPVRATEIFDLGDDRFLLLGRVSAHGSASGVVVDSEWGLLATISDGLIIREENFLDRAEALRAAGLSDAPSIRGPR